MQVQLTREEFNLLLPLIEDRIAEYYIEIRHADISSYKELLKTRKQQLQHVHELLISARENPADFSAEDTETLKTLINTILQDLPVEIRRSQSSHWREKLKKEKRLLQKILRRLQYKNGSAASPPSRRPAASP